MDQETKEQLAEVANIKHTLDTPGWGIIESRINGLIEDLCDFRGIGKDLDPTERIRLLEVREGAAELIEKWIKTIKGDAEWAEPLKGEKGLSDTIYTSK